MKRSTIYLVVAVSAVLAIAIFLQSKNLKAKKIQKVVYENAVSVIEFFPSTEYPPSPYEKPPRIHYNFRYDVDGDTLIIKIDDWRFNGGRKNQLRVYYVPLSKIDTGSIELQMEKMRVGPVSYKGEKEEIQPRRIILWTKGRQMAFKMEAYDKGTGPATSMDADRWVIPSEGAEISHVNNVEIHVPNEKRAKNIVDTFKECL